ncbi:hypothetical protein I6I98_08880 [Sphingobacterium multivorum]|uniref:Uncharacterized protein n=1 Tax=Sphingobacterium multivorum TaxID=28454 RepID=A0ABX7CW95_SPHMU|nr:hypothetical protein [Sphingobacterium multivorum]QQT55349.1 hypothetical protein I6I98_08880 [Sphingobacterium multivorum]
MGWKENLSKIIINSGYQLSEISAWTNIEVPILSNMKNLKYPNFTCKEFLLLKLLLKKEHQAFLNEIFGEGHFDKIEKVNYAPSLTKLGEILRDRHKFEVLPKKEIVENSQLKSSRIDYLIAHEDENIKIEEITKLELAFGEELGCLCKLRFSELKINTEGNYLLKLDQIKEYNREANNRRKK